MRYTLTSFIKECMEEDKINEYSFNEDRSILHICMRGYGDSIDYLSNGEWEECEFITQGFYPIQDDTNVEDILDDTTPTRIHDYCNVGLQWWLELPPNRKRGDTYTLSQLRDMINTADGWGDYSPGGGFSYYNVTE